MSTVLRIGIPSKDQTALPEEAALDTRIALIQALIPLGLQAVQDVLQREVAALAGPRYARHDSAPHVVRWGRQRGSIYLADQKGHSGAPGPGSAGGPRGPRAELRPAAGATGSR